MPHLGVSGGSKRKAKLRRQHEASSFTIRQRDDGVFDILFHNVPVPIGRPEIECPYEAKAYLKALREGMAA